MLSRGFSLFEVLVVLVIMGLVTAISMTMLSQLRRNLERFFPASEYFTRLEIRTNMLSNMIGSLVPARLPAEPFKGEQLGFSGLATYFPGDSLPNEQRVRLAIVRAGGATRVTAERIAPDGGVLATFEILDLLCDEARFYYLDEDMMWVNQWMQRSEFPFMPFAIRFSCSNDSRPLHLISAIEREGSSIMSDVSIFQIGR